MNSRGEDERADPKLALIQAGVALVLLLGLPLLLEAPTTALGVAGLVAVGMLLLAFFAEGVVRFVRSRRRPFADSIIPPEIVAGKKPPKVDE